MKSYFKTLCAQTEEYPKIISQIKKILIPLYGEELTTQALEKVSLGKDRVCEVFYEDDTPRGLIIFKNFINNEYEPLGIINGYEQKTALVMVPEDGTERRFAVRKEIMHKLVNRGANNAISMGAESFFGSVSSELNGTLRLLMNLGFEIAASFKDKFKNGETEHLVVHKNLENLKRNSSSLPLNSLDRVKTIAEDIAVSTS